ncbi:monocarboxylate transporter 12-like [Physella acuta]|uniref:monocarboxylate transporter 12-like n=1 Tax=Physella acuta TaxID=109671 RepID=UPI0027DC5EC4|nr:monocarboxylate transporter 12-like [Physella acuta]
MTRPIDRGWAWMVVLGSFVIFLIHASFFSVTSVLFLDFIEQFDTSTTVITTILSLTQIAYCSSTLVIVNLLMPRLSIRTITTTCCIVYSLSTLAIAVLPKLPVFFVVCIVKYLAQGGALVPSVYLVGHYFDRRRALATSLSLIGISLSNISVAPVVRYLREEYGFRGCFILIAAFEMHSIIAALLLRPLSYYDVSPKVPPNDLHAIENTCENLNELSTVSNLSDETCPTEALRNQKHDHVTSVERIGKTHINSDDVIHVESNVDDSKLNAIKEQEFTTQNQRHNDQDVTCMVFSDHQISESSKEDETTRVLGLFDNNMLKTANDHQPVRKITNHYILRKKIRACLHLTIKIFDPSLLKNYLAVMYLISYTMFNSSVFVYMYLPSYAIKVGVNQSDAAFLLTAVGITNCLSCIAYGHFADLHLIRPGKIMAGVFLIMAVVCHCSRFFTNFGALVFMACTLGSLGFAYLSLNSPLIVDLLGVDTLGRIFALGTLAASVAICIQFPIHGFLIERTGTFVASFHVVGATYMLGSLCLLLEPLVRRWQGAREVKAGHL